MANLREVRRLRMTDGTQPNWDTVFEAHSYANEKHCIVELEWVNPHYGVKSWTIEPENNLEDLLRDLNVK